MIIRKLFKFENVKRVSKRQLLGVRSGETRVDVRRTDAGVHIRF